MNKHLTKGATWDSMFLAIVRLVTTLVSIFQTKVLSTGLSLVEYGTYSQANVVIQISVSLLLLGLVDSINYFYNGANSKDIENRRKTINTIFGIEIIVGVVVAAIIIFGRNLISSFFSNKALAGVLVIIAIKPMLDNLIHFYQVLYISAQRARLIAIRNLFISIVKIIATVICVYIVHDVKTIFIVFVLLDTVQLIILKVWFSKIEFMIEPHKGEWKRVKPILSYGIPMGVYTLTSMLTREMDKIVVGNLADTETLAIYANCSRILPFDIVSLAFVSVLVPYIVKYVSSGEYSKAKSLYSDYMKIGYYSVWMFAMAIIVTAPEAISFFYDDVYRRGQSVFIIYIVDSMVKFASIHLILTSSGNSRVIMKYSVVTLVANAVINVVLFKTIGIVGPAIATLLVTLMYTFLIINKSIKILHSYWGQVFDYKGILKYVCMLSIIGIMTLQFKRYMHAHQWNEFVIFFISVAAFCSSILLLNRKDIFETLKRINENKL